MLVSNKVAINLVVNFNLTFDDAALNKEVSCKRGDKVTTTIRLVTKELVTITGVITKITASVLVEGDMNPTLVIDASEDFASKVYTVQSIDVMDIDLFVEP